MRKTTAKHCGKCLLYFYTVNFESKSEILSSISYILVFFLLFIVAYRPPAFRAFNDSSNALLPPIATNHTEITSPTDDTLPVSASLKHRTRRPDRAVYVPRARRSQTTPPSTSASNVQIISISPPNNNNHIQQSSPVCASSALPPPLQLPTNEGPKSPAAEFETVRPVIVKNLRKSESIDESTLVNSYCTNMAPNKNNKQSIIIDEKPPSKTTPPKDEDGEKEEKELRKASKEMNRSTKRIIKQTFNSNVLEIEPPHQENHVKNGKVKLKESKSVNPEEDDWESMFDDNGECLDPNLLEELTAQVGKVTIEKPKTDYKVVLLLKAEINVFV